MSRWQRRARFVLGSFAAVFLVVVVLAFKGRAPAAPAGPGVPTDPGPYGLIDVVRCAVRSVGHRPQNRQTLGRDGQTVLPEKHRCQRHVSLAGHTLSLTEILE